MKGRRVPFSACICTWHVTIKLNSQAHMRPAYIVSIYRLAIIHRYPQAYKQVYVQHSLEYNPHLLVPLVIDWRRGLVRFYLLEASSQVNLCRIVRPWIISRIYTVSEVDEEEDRNAVLVVSVENVTRRSITLTRRMRSRSC